MKQEVLVGQTDYTVLVLIRDTAGAPATGLDETDIDIAYARVETDNDVTTADVTPASLASLTAAHADWGFEEVSATDHPGLYRLDIADAVFASGAWSAVVSIVGTGLDPCQIEFVLVNHNPFSAIADILTDTGTTLQGELDGIQADTEDIQSRLPAALVSGRIDASVGAMAANVLTATAINADAITAAKVAADVTTEIQSGLATAAELAKVPKSDGTATWNATALASINAEADTALADYDPPTKAELDAAVANVSVDEIQATALADLFNTDSGTTYASAVAGSVVAEIADNAGGSALTAAAIADAVWDEAQADHVGAGTFGEVATEVAAILVDTGTTLDGKIDTIDTNVDAILVDTGTTLQAELDGIQADTEDIQSRLPAALVSGRIDASVGAMAANVMTAAAAAADLTTELQSGLATAANLATVDTVVDAIKAVTDLLPDAGALSSLATAAALATVDTVADGIKAKTDSLTFTTAGMVDSAVKRVGDTTLTAAGTGGQGYGAA